MGGTWYTVRAGDTLSKIASQHGFADWQTIYRQNADFFRKSRGNDPTWIEPGDRLFIPERLAKKVSCAPAQRHQFQLRKVAPLQQDDEIVPKARKAHKAYLDARDDYVKWMVDPKGSAKRYLENEEGFWASLATKEGSAEAAEGSEFVKKPFEFAEPFLDALGEFVGNIVRVKRETAVQYIAQLIAVRFQLRAVDLVTKDVIEIRGGMVAAVLYRREVTYLVKTQPLEAIGHGVTGVVG